MNFYFDHLDLNIHSTIKKITLRIMLGSIPHKKFCFYHLPTRGRAGIKLGDAWYVSNVSIIFDCSMLLYYPFWMFMGFILHIYIIFGTNLLTGGPARIAVFLSISVFRRKGISNGVGTEWNLLEKLFLEGKRPDRLGVHVRKETRDHEAGGRPQGGGHAPYPCEHLPSFLTCTPSPSGGFPSKNNFSSWFRSVLTPSDIPFPRNTKIGIKQQNWAGPPVNRLVPKII